MVIFYSPSTKCPECGGMMEFDGYKHDQCEKCGYVE